MVGRLLSGTSTWAISEYTPRVYSGVGRLPTPLTRQNLLVVRLVHRHNPAVAESLTSGLKRRRRYALPQRLVGEQAQRRSGHAIQIVGSVEEAARTVLDDFRQPAYARRHDRNLARHRLERSETEALLGRRQQEHVRRRKQRRNLILFSEKLHVAGKA